MNKLDHYNVLVIEDQPENIEIFSRRFDTHRIDFDGTRFEVNYYFLPVKLDPPKTNSENLSISNETVISLGNYLIEEDIDLIMVDYAFVLPEKDEELTYKLNNRELHTKEQLLGIYVLDASELFKGLFKVNKKAKYILKKDKIQIMMYTYPADSLMHLLGDAKQRMNKLSRVLKREIEVLDTRQLLYGGDKSLEEHHDRKLYPQLLSGYLNLIVLNCVNTKLSKLIPLYKNIKVKRSIFAVTLIASFAGGVAFTVDFITSNISSLWATNQLLALILIAVLIVFVFSAGSFFAIFFERLVRNLVIWLEIE